MLASDSNSDQVHDKDGEPRQPFIPVCLDSKFKQRIGYGVVLTN